MGLIRGKLPAWAEVFTGDGYGYGYGSGYKIRCVIAQLPAAQRVRFAELSAGEATLAFWKSTQDGKPANGGSANQAAFPGQVLTTEGPLRLCEPGTLHATLKPEKWKGSRLWIVALFGEVQFQDDKMGALKREIIGEVIL